MMTRDEKENFAKYKHQAPEGKVWVCAACGKRSKDIYGDKSLNYGWDVSCAMNSSLFDEDQLEIKDGLVVHIKGK